MNMVPKGANAWLCDDDDAAVNLPILQAANGMQDAPLYDPLYTHCATGLDIHIRE